MIVRAIFAALLAIGTVVWAVGRDGHDQPTADLHADADYYYVYLPSLLHGDLDFTDEYRETHNWYRLGPTPTHRPGNVFGIGPAVFSAPLFAVGHGIALVTGSRDDGFSAWEIRLYTWSSLAWTLGAVLVAARLVRRRLGGGTLSLVGPLLAALAGPVVYYAVRQPGYAHPVATFFATLLVERWDASYDAPRTLRTWLVLGALLGAAMLARPQLALWGILLAGAAVDDLRRQRDRRVLARWLAAAAALLVVFSPQLIAWKVLYGEWWTVPQGPGFMRWDAPCWSETLFSSRNGLFPWSPAYLVFAIALAASVRRMPRLVGFVFAGFALQAVANGAVWDWWAGGSFGGRRFDSTYVVFAVGAAVIVAWIASARGRVRIAIAAGLGVVIACLVVVNLQLTAATTVTSARITGGEAASAVIERSVHGPHARIAAWASALSNLPARLAFAWRHDVSLAMYDRVVGVHALGDTYPGLNSYADRRTATVPVTGDHVLIELNRTGTLDVKIPIDGDGHVTITWNGDAVVDQAIAPGTPLHFRTTDLRRGANDLVIEAPHGSVVHPIQLEALAP